MRTHTHTHSPTHSRTVGLESLRLVPRIHFTDLDFHTITQHGALTDKDGRISAPIFDRIMRQQVLFCFEFSSSHHCLLDAPLWRIMLGVV